MERSGSAIAILGTIIVLAGFTDTASAQYGVSGNPTGATPAMLEECQRLGIERENCTENNILAKHRLMQSQGTEMTTTITMSKVSDDGRYEALITWIPDDIGKTNTFRVTLYDPKELGARQPLDDKYDLVIYKEEQTVVPGRVVSFPNGTTEYSVGFPYNGEFTLSVGINDGVEVIEMPIQVTPEFPVGLGLSLALAGSVVAIVVLGRSRFAWFQ